MPIDNALAQKVISEVNPDELAQLLCDLSNIPSATGHERAIAEFILDWYRANGIKAVPQIVDTDRMNAVGILKGSGMGLSLTFNGHMDTTFIGTDEDLLMVPEVAAKEDLTAMVVDDKVVGPGVNNMKGGLASFMMAGKALRRSGVTLKGDVILAAVAGEISRSPVDSYQGPEYRGEGVGTRHLLVHGIQSDYAICADGHDMSLVWAQCGVVQMKITVHAAGGHDWGTTRITHPSEKVNAIVKMMKVIQALEEWGERWEQENIYHAHTGPDLLPRVNISAIEGGAPFRTVFFPIMCNLYVEVRIPPHIRPVSVLHDVEEALSQSGLECDIEVYRSMQGFEANGAEPLAEAIEDVHQYLFDRPVAPATSANSSIWTDTNVYNEVGIPCLKIGPKGRSIKPRLEEIDIEEMAGAAKLYALVALDICNRPRPGSP